MRLRRLRYHYNYMRRISDDYKLKSTYQITSTKMEYVLQSSDQSLSQKLFVQVGPPNEHNGRQLWLIQGHKGKGFEIINGLTNCVIVEEGDNVWLKSQGLQKNINWSFEFLMDNVVAIRLTASKDRYICVENGVVKIKKLQSQSMADTWFIRQVTNNSLLNKSCFIKSTDTNHLVAIPGAQRKQGTHLIIYQPDYRYNQRWNIYRAGQIFVIKSFYNKLNWDVVQGKFEEGTPIVQWSSHGGVNQFWRMERIGDKRNVFRIYTCYDNQLELGHRGESLVLIRGRQFTWEIQGYIPI